MRLGFWGGNPEVTTGTLGQVQNLLMDLQGQSSSNSTPSPPTPPLPNQQRLRWDVVAGATGYNIWRSVNGGAFTLYDTSPTNSYTDLAATLCVNGTAGAGPDFYPANVYRYKIAATAPGFTTGLLSATQSCIYYANGVQEHTGGDFNANMTSDYASNTGAPQGGHTLCLKNTTSGVFGDWIPWAGNLATQWNLTIGAYNFLRLDVKAMQTGSGLQFAPIRVGDVAIQAQGGGQLLIQSTAYAPLVNGVWVTLIIPLSDLMTDWTSGSGVQLHAFYKTNVQDTIGTVGNIYYFDNVMFTP